jgi:hypothetical protein
LEREVKGSAKIVYRLRFSLTLAHLFKRNIWHLLGFPLSSPWITI